MRKNIKYKNGFTLIELLAVMVVVIVIGGIGFSIIFSSLRATNKTNTLTSARQNGNYAISQMSKMIRFAKRFDGISADDSLNSYLTNCAQETVVPPSPTPTLVEYHYLKVTSFDGGQTKFSCAPATLAPPAGLISSGSGTTTLPLIDTTSIIVNSCYFTCDQTSSSDFPTISINFNLSQKEQNPLVERKASIDFNTSIVIRNLNR